MNPVAAGTKTAVEMLKGIVSRCRCCSLRLTWEGGVDRNLGQKGQKRRNEHQKWVEERKMNCEDQYFAVGWGSQMVLLDRIVADAESNLAVRHCAAGSARTRIGVGRTGRSCSLGNHRVQVDATAGRAYGTVRSVLRIDSRALGRMAGKKMEELGLGNHRFLGRYLHHCNRSCSDSGTVISSPSQR